MMTPEENDLLCRVEGDAPMGQIMRRHWIPACLSEEVAEPDGAPVKVRLLGEDLVVFRDSKGRVGVLDEYCPHRRASLLFGRNEECGLRCLYHGWKFDVDGNVVEMASEPADSLIFERVKHKAYPAREAGGFVWAYMGPPEDDARIRAAGLGADAGCARERDESARALQLGADPRRADRFRAFARSLHSSDMVPAQVDGAKATEANWLRPSTDKAPRFQIERTSYGFRYAAIRRPIKNAETHDYVRTTVYIAPFTALIPPNNVHNVATLLTPDDDTNTIFYFIAWNGPDKPGIDADTWRKFNVLQWGVDVDRNFDGIRNRANLYLQDRAAMKAGNFTGISGIPNQDIAMWESMGPIGDRSKERVGASDVAVVAFRRLMVEAARAMRDGGPAIGTTEPRIRACDDQLLRGRGAQDDELAQPRGRQRGAAPAVRRQTEPAK